MLTFNGDMLQTEWVEQWNLDNSLGIAEAVIGTWSPTLRNLSLPGFPGERNPDFTGHGYLDRKRNVWRLCISGQWTAVKTIGVAEAVMKANGIIKKIPWYAKEGSFWKTFDFQIKQGHRPGSHSIQKEELWANYTVLFRNGKNPLYPYERGKLVWIVWADCSEDRVQRAWPARSHVILASVHRQRYGWRELLESKTEMKTVITGKKPCTLTMVNWQASNVMRWRMVGQRWTPKQP